MDTTGTAPWGSFNPQPITRNYTTNNLNQYSEITSPQPQVPSNYLSYDDDGNLTRNTTGGPGDTYTYDAENRLIGVQSIVSIAEDRKLEFAYDYMGRKVQKKVYEFIAGDWQLKTDNLFLYDGWNLISESSV